MAGKIFLWLTIASAIFGGVSMWILDNMVCFILAVVLFIFNGIVTVCINPKYKEFVIELLDVF